MKGRVQKILYETKVSLSEDLPTKIARIGHTSGEIHADKTFFNVLNKMQQEFVILQLVYVKEFIINGKREHEAIFKADAKAAKQVIKRHPTNKKSDLIKFFNLIPCGLSVKRVQKLVDTLKLVKKNEENKY